MAARDTRALLIIIASLGGLVIFVLGIGIWLTHKVAGPLFIVGRYLNDIAEGRFSQPRPLRQGDELQDFYDTFQSMVKGLSDRERADLDSVREALASLAKGSDPSSVQTAIATLRILEERKQRALN
jgi:nitrogen fixation/metabolism regulation signal transduction histidine kinase